MLHLIGNAHIDPVWLWEWEEGTASDLCEEFDGISWVGGTCNRTVTCQLG